MRYVRAGEGNAVLGSQGHCVETRVDQAGEDLAGSYANLFRELTAVFRARGLSRDEASDLSQESLVRTLVHLKRHGRTQPDLRPLVHTIARRLYVERGRRPRPRLVGLPEAEHLADPSPEPVDQVVSVEERQGVREALASLAPRHRRVVSMWMSGLRPPEIARELGIKRNAADALLHRARRQLAMKLDPSKVSFGVLGIFVLRLRAATRRVVDGVLSLDPSGTLTQATAGLATVGIAAILIASSAPDSVPRTVTPGTRPAVAVEGVTPEASVAEERASVARAPGMAADPNRPAIRSVGIEAGIGHDEDNTVGAGILFVPEQEEQSTFGPLVDVSVDMVCGTSTAICTTQPGE